MLMRRISSFHDRSDCLSSILLPFLQIRSPVPVRKAFCSTPKWRMVWMLPKEWLKRFDHSQKYVSIKWPLKLTLSWDVRPRQQIPELLCVNRKYTLVSLPLYTICNSCVSTLKKNIPFHQRTMQWRRSDLTQRPLKALVTTGVVNFQPTSLNPSQPKWRVLCMPQCIIISSNNVCVSPCSAKVAFNQLSGGLAL